MDKDRVKGAINDAAGRAKRQVGEWTGDTNAQVEGAVQQAKGKAQKVWGNVKDAVRDAAESAQHGSKTGVDHENEMERKREAGRQQELERTHTSHSQ